MPRTTSAAVQASARTNAEATGLRQRWSTVSHGGQRRVAGQIGAQQQDGRRGERAEALGVGEERDADPVEPEQEMGEAEAPAEHERRQRRSARRSRSSSPAKASSSGYR